MESNVNTQLKQAKKLYDSKKYEESLNLYELIFNENPDEFKLHDRISYSWAIYQVHVKGFADENELFDATDFITDLIQQADLNRSNTCPYTFSVFRVLDYLYEEKEYYNISYWLDKLDPELLDEKKKTTGEELQDQERKSTMITLPNPILNAPSGICALKFQKRLSKPLNHSPTTVTPGTAGE